MRPALLQVTESADSYEPVTVALFALFIVMLASTAGLLLKDLLESDRKDQPVSAAWGDPAQTESVTGRHQAPVQTTPASIRSAAEPGSVPAWYNQAVSGHSTGAAAGVHATIERMVEAANRGDLRLGFSLYTPELLGRQQWALGLDAGEFERLLRGEPQPAEPPLVIAEVFDVVLDPPFRAAAQVSYRATGDQQRPGERLRFVYDQRNLVWLIDEIEIAPS